MSSIASVPAPRVDLSFTLAGDTVPRDHGYALFGAICRVLGDLHGADWLAVHPLHGLPRPDGLLSLPGRRSQLRLRVVPGEIPRVLPLAGKRLDVDGRGLLVGVSQVYALAPAPSVTSRLVVIKGYTEPDDFAGALGRKLAQLGVTARAELGRRRVLAIAGDTVVGFAVTLHDLSDEASLAVQYAGIGGRQRMGCGVFVPYRERN